MLKFLIFTIVAAASASVIHDGSCPDDIKPIDDFNFKAFEGLWYEYAKFPTEAEKNAECGTTEYIKEGDSLKVKNAHVVNGVQKFIEGSFSFPQGEKVAEIALDYKIGDYESKNNIWVIDTDYNNYAVIFMCKNQDGKSHKENLWIASRSKTLVGEPMAELTKYLKDKGFETSKLVDTNFSEEACKYTEKSPIEEYPYKN